VDPMAVAPVVDRRPDRRAAVPVGGPRVDRTAVAPVVDRRPDRTAAVPVGHRVSPAPVDSHPDRTPPDHRPPHCAVTSTDRADSIEHRVDLTQASVETDLSGVREHPRLTSVGPSADRAGPTPDSAAASTGLAQHLASSGRASVVRARRPSRHGEDPAETSAFTGAGQAGPART